MSSTAALNNITATAPGTISTTPASVLKLGIRKSGDLIVKDAKETTDYRDRSFSKNMNFTFEGVSLQPTIASLKAAADLCRTGADVQIVTSKQDYTAGSEDVFQFFGNDKLGVHYKLELTEKSRELTVKFARTFPENKAKDIMDAADSNTEVLIGSDGAGEDFAKFRAPSYMGTQLDGAEFSPFENIISRKLTIEPVEKLNADDMPMKPDWQMVSGEIVSEAASIAEIMTILNSDRMPAIVWKEGNDDGNYDSYEIARGHLSTLRDIKLGDERYKKIIFKGKVPIHDQSFEFGIGKGSTADDTTGEKGGTWKIAG